MDVIEMGSAGGTSIVDLTSKDYITGAVTVYGADQGRSVFWGTDADDTFISGGGDSVIFGGGGFNQSQLGAGRDILQFRSLVDSGNQIKGFGLTKDVIELWQEQGEFANAPVVTGNRNSTWMLWGNNMVEFVGMTGLSAENILIANQLV